jgi:anaerobic magnesium-protoporphyrin IX monomethyl ester cyclase
VTGSKLRALTPENVISEIEFLIREYKIREIIFYDDSFTLDQDRAMKICELIIQRGIKIKWQCETRVNLVNNELLKKMKQAGCYLIAYGIESGSEKVLKILKKGVSIIQIRNAIDITRKVGIKMIGYFMVGIPGETEDEIKQTIKFSKELDIDFAQYAVATAYPGTELFQIAKSQNKISGDWSKSIYALGTLPIVSLSDISEKVLASYIRKAYRSFYFRPSYIIRKIKGIKTYDDFLYYIRGLKTLLKQVF